MRGYGSMATWLNQNVGRYSFSTVRPIHLGGRMTWFRKWSVQPLDDNKKVIECEWEDEAGNENVLGLEWQEEASAWVVYGPIPARYGVTFDHPHAIVRFSKKFSKQNEPKLRKHIIELRDLLKKNASQQTQQA